MNRSKRMINNKKINNDKKIIKKNQKVKKCSKITEKDEKNKIKCIRKDGKVFDFPRRFSKKKCSGKIRGFSMRSSCAPFK